ncbi:ATP-binding protein [Methanoregula sp.]|uniref:ATP-binding protein n=1 Tax=Methanoregula sp. TaxID=2052170 RepID=UPI00236CF4C3|nr:ATP-binding protein [Methanoregula sp.]MDD1685868.1 response regulator [Methanoregula sp.]
MTRILIVDDHPPNLYLLESILKGNGYDVISAVNGADALAVAGKTPPDLLITDILMPVMDGFELCRQWKADEHLKQIPFIFYTATYIDVKDEQFAYSLGAERFIIKPQKPEILIKEVRNVLEASSRARDKPIFPIHPLGDEMEVLRQYNEVLFRKLEKKVLQLEAEIAERKTAEKQRETVIRELEQKNAELARFTYTVSHELRSPLVTIQGFSGMIEDEISQGSSDTAGLLNHAHRISTAVDRLDELLSDLLKLSRAGQNVGKPERIGFGIIAHEVMDYLARPLDDQSIRVEIAPDLPVVNVDHTRMREVLLNLMENAIRFRGDQPDPVIRIGVNMQGGDPVFFVQDNGMGIEPQYLERIFNLFEKLDASTPGTGVGLAIVRRIIEVHGGKIWAESDGIGNGTTFRFTLPVVGVTGTDNNNTR